MLTFGTDVNLSQKAEENETLLRNLPGVMSASLANNVPLSGSGSASGFTINPAGQDGLRVRSAYFHMDEFGIDSLGVEIAEGRNFTPEEVIITESREQNPTVAIVSRNFIDEIYPEGDGLGKTMFFGETPIQIVGVVDKMMGPWLKDSSANNVVIMPNISANNRQTFIVRTHPSQRAALMLQIEDIMLADYDKRVIYGIQGLDESKADYNAGDILMKRMLITLIVVLVAVTALGIFGLTVFNINKRTKQIGTRRALGARKSSIVSYFLVENMMISLMGVIVGGVAAVLLGNYLLEEYSLPALDNMYVLGTTIFVMAISLLSVVLPANNAANISPSIATRSV
jgi:putative ABC transport system permease protein